MKQSQYINIAFISYKREDEEWAKWLQDKLEHYKLPTEITKENPELEFKDRPRHVFKDTTDLSGGVLAKAIKEGLESSKYLIVICSPRAAKSHWVCKEVQEFIDSGREEYIIPFIIDGEPNSNNPDKECFPSALKSLSGERELLGININENGRDSAAVKVIARMFDLRFDTLWDRFQRETKRRRQYVIAGLVTLVISVIAIASWIGWQYMELDKRNTQIEEQNTRIKEQIEQIEQQNKSLDAKSDSLSTANDSITKQKTQLLKAYNDLTLSQKNLAKSNADLEISNLRLQEEINNVLIAQSKNSAGKIDELTNNNDILLAQNFSSYILSELKWPYTPEMEKAFRNSTRIRNFDGLEELMLYKDFPNFYSQKNEHYHPYALCHGSNNKQKAIENCGFCPHSNLVIFSCDGEYYLKDAITGIEKKLNGTITNIEGYVFSKNGNYVMSCSSWNDLPKIWSLPNGDFVKELEYNSDGEILDSFFKENFDDKFAEGNSSTTAWINDDTPNIIQDPVTGLFCSSDSSGTFILSSNSDTIQCIKKEMASVISFSEYGHLLVVDGVIYSDLIQDYFKPTKIPLNYYNIENVAFSDDNTLLALYEDDECIFIHDLINNKNITKINVHCNIANIKFSKDKQYLIATDHDQQHLIIWKINDGKIIMDYNPANGQYICFTNSSNENIFITYTDEANETVLERWNLKTNQCTYRKKGIPISDYSGINANRNETEILFYSTDSVYLYKLQNDIMVSQVAMFHIVSGTGGNGILATEFIGNNILLVAEAGTHKILDSKTLDEIYSLDGFGFHTSVNSGNYLYNISNDKKTLTTITGEGVLQICDINTGLLLDYTDIENSSDDFDVLGLGCDGRIVVVKDRTNNQLVILKYPSFQELLYNINMSSGHRTLTEGEKQFLNLK